MSADRMVNREKEGVTEARGDVYLRRTDPSRGVLWEAWGDKGIYDSKASSGTIVGHVMVEVRRSTPTVGMTRIWADRASYDSSAQALRFEGAPASDGPRAKLMPPWPKDASPNPRAVETGDAGVRDVSGKTLVYFEADRRVTVDGSVRVRWEGIDVASR
jgi:hypothetical protein